MDYHWIFAKLSLLSSRFSDGTKISVDGYFTRETLYSRVTCGVDETHKDQEVLCHRNWTFYKQVVCRLWHLTVELCLEDIDAIRWGARTLARLWRVTIPIEVYFRKCILWNRIFIFPEVNWAKLVRCKSYPASSSPKLVHPGIAR